MLPADAVVVLLERRARQPGERGSEHAHVHEVAVVELGIPDPHLDLEEAIALAAIVDELSERRRHIVLVLIHEAIRHEVGLRRAREGDRESFDELLALGA